MERTFLTTAMALALALPAGLARADEVLPKVDLQLVAEGFNAPLLLTAPPDGSGRRFVGDQLGLLWVLDAKGKRLEPPFLDLRDRLTPLRKAFDERGLLALAFHPDFAGNGLFYVNYSAKRRPASPYAGKTAYTWRMSEFKVSADDPNRADRASERVLLELDWVNRKHNGGGLAFGPDGYLYVGVGDGGGAHGVPDIHVAPKSKDPARHAEEIPEDPFKIPKRFHKYDRYAQDTQRLNGKILRLDVDRGHPGYAIPTTNIFRGKVEGRDEIYAWGFRNPFRLTFDKAGNGDMFVSGVAESFWETVYLVDRPGNYGWAIREGRHCYDRARAFDPPEDCARKGALGEPIRDPIVEYANWSVMRKESAVKARPMGTANIGGFVYRGKALPGLYGRFVFGDFSSDIRKPSGQLFVATPSNSWRAQWSVARLAQLDVRLHSLGQDADGELYLLTTAHGIPVGQSGKVWKLVPAR
ncbi:MAG: PQQ-dependent sugar dehydrogenase [Alphaproteobacteria bacterium]|nr:PQQ-dependent sugar dehydrogenase [Alphaproteobacteria bacterium]MDP6566420.1 PQQ-dependent sugar dehydrogenase [Alphaproteobacteria bacterium]MDP6811622.1 PQQ-dependent sugar dehydrogenase [Alphaproteobacteria bacterium]